MLTVSFSLLTVTFALIALRMIARDIVWAKPSRIEESRYAAAVSEAQLQRVFLARRYIGETARNVGA